MTAAGRSVVLLTGGGRISLGMSAETVYREPNQDVAAGLAKRRESYDLTAFAGRLLFDPNKAFKEQHRTVWCHRRVKNETRIASIYKRVDGCGARISGLTTCGRIWTCKVCCGRVAERRREELDHAIRYQVQVRKAHAYLLTLTAPHELTLPLADFRVRLAKALKSFKNSKTYRRIREQFQHAGSVRSLEVLWGSVNGWHLHAHELYFAAPGLESVRDDLAAAWVTALLKAGLGDRTKITWMMEHGLDLRGGQAAADYVTKFGHDAEWGLSSEITRSHVKVGLRQFTGNVLVTPFQILAWAANGDDLACTLFREYAAAMEGARMLYWSPGLKAKLGLDDRDDEQVAADETPKPEEKAVADINDKDLALVLSRNALGELLEFVCLADGVEREHIQACVRDFLDSLRSRPPKGKGVIEVRRWGERRDAKLLKEEGRDRFDTVRLRSDRLVAA